MRVSWVRFLAMGIVGNLVPLAEGGSEARAPKSQTRKIIIFLMESHVRQQEDARKLDGRHASSVRANIYVYMMIKAYPFKYSRRFCGH